MKGILVFCYRDWLDPRAGYVEEYAHNVFSRIAAQGCYVAWICRNHPWFARRKDTRPQVEIVDGIQISRLGSGLAYRAMTGMLMAQLAQKTELMARFDAIVDCVTSYPLPLAEYARAPIVPLVFSLGKKARAFDEPPGPIVAATLRAKKRLLTLGVPAKFIIHAPAGTEPAEPLFDHAESLLPTVAAMAEDRKDLLKAVHFLKREGLAVSIEDARRHRDCFQHAWLGYCGPGFERETLAMAANGIPALCPVSDATEEYLEEGITGCLYAAGDWRDLADKIRQLVEGSFLRGHMAEQAKHRAAMRSWERTASLVLAAIENLEPEKNLALARRR